MMVTKKLLSFIFLSFLAGGTCMAQVKGDIRAGVNFSNVVAKDRDGKVADTESVPGLYVGLGVNVPVWRDFSVHPAFVYARRGFKQHGDASHIGWGKDFEARSSYLELPVDIVYSPKVGLGNLILGAGPYVGYGTGGKWKTEGPVLIGDIMMEGQGSLKFQNDLSYRGDQDYAYAKPWDYGWHAKVGYALFGKYSVQLEMQRSIGNLDAKWGNSPPDGDIKNKSMGISVGYTF